MNLLLLLLFFQVDSAWSAGNYESARSSAKTAKILNIVGFVIGGITCAGVVVGIIVIVTATAASAAVAIR